MRTVVGLVAGVLLLTACGAAPDAPGPGATATPTAAPATPTATGSAQERAQALAAVPASLARVSAAQRQAACSSYTAGKDAFLSAFEQRFDAQYSAITPDELDTVRGTLDQVCGG